MNVTAVLTEETIKNKKIEIEEHAVHDLVVSASRVIAPLSPISNFAARNPWTGLEKQSFEQVAHLFKTNRGVDIYPSASILRSAKKRGEIDESFLQVGLQKWLDSQTFHLPRETAERFCQEALKLDTIPSSLLLSPELNKLGNEIMDLDMTRIENYSSKPISAKLKNQDGERIINELDYHVIKWCKLYLDDSQTGWSMPNRDKGFYHAWHRLIQHDPLLNKNQRKILKRLPQEAHTALLEVLSALDISRSEIQTYLEGHLLSLPGWAGMMLWRSQQSSHEYTLLTEYLAIRISMEWVLVKPYLPLSNQQFEKKGSIKTLLASWIHWGNLSIEEWYLMSSFEQLEYLSFANHFDENLRRKLWLEAWEQTYTERLKEKITTKQHVVENKKSVLAQLAFCIDVRSEPFRRQLEKEGPFETMGVAGFFGLPIAISELGSHHVHASMPVIQKPKHQVKEFTDNHKQETFQQRKQVENSLSYTFKMMKHNVLTSLLLPEISGPWLSMRMLARSFIPRIADNFIRKLRKNWLNKPETNLSLHYDHDIDSEIPVGFSKKEKVEYVRQALQLMGLTKDIAPLVAICGHGSQSINNPYASALDCGACGGAAGGFNARVLATLCNLQEVREVLSLEGINIPKETVFVAAEHNTTVDELHWIYVPELSKSAQEAFDHIKAILPKVTRQANEERLAKLPNLNLKLKNPSAEAHRFAEDWSEIRPEWGLARNASFIVGQRELTQDCDLEGRSFLHNYDWRQDESGQLLTNIIAGPGTVSQMINLQYYASTVAPHYYGSGNKATQTVTANLGVMQGNASDLLSGLPWQSVMLSDIEAFHDPLRLLIVIQAPEKYVERLLKNDFAFREKVQNGWLRLASVDSNGNWKNW